MATKIRTTITQDKPDHAEPGEITAWFAELAARDDVVAIVVQRKNALGKWASLPKWRLEPPYDRDLTPLYDEFGDGEYRYAAVDGSGRYTAGAKVETIEGYGAGKRGQPGKTATATDMSELVASMREQMDMTRLMVMNEQLNRQLERMRGASDGPPVHAPTGYAPDPMANLESMTSVIANIVAAITPKQDSLTKLVEALIPTLLNRPQETTRSLLDSVGQVLDLKDRLGSPEPHDLDWKTLLMIGLSGLWQNPAIQAKIQTLMTSALARPNATASGPGAPAAPLSASNADRAIPTREPEVVTHNGATAPTHEEYAEADQTLRTQIWPLIKKAIAKGSDEYGIYADLIDEHLPGFLGAWTTADFEPACKWIERLDPDIERQEPKTIAWLRNFYTFIREGGQDDGE